MKTLEDAVEFHGHICPGLALGYRAAIYAMNALGKRAEDEELVAIVENDSCAVDAVQVVTGCTFGKGNLIHRDYGKHVYTFIRRPSGETLRVSVEWIAPEDTPEEAAAWERYSKGERSDEISRIVHDRKSRKVKAILEAPEEALFKVSREKATLPHEARIRASVRCSQCGEKTMETRARLLYGKPCCQPCFDRIEEETE